MTTIDPAAAAAADTIAQFEGPSSAVDSMQRWLHSHPLASPTLVLVLASLYFSLFTERFFTARNLSTILAQVTIIGTLAVAQTLVVLTAGIDLSVGSITVLSSVVMGKLALGWGYAPVLALLLGHRHRDRCAARSTAALITRLRIPPFIATLGTFNALFALSQWFSENETLRNQDLKAQASILLVVRPHRGSRSRDSGSRTARCSCSSCSSSRGTCCGARRGVVTSTPPATTVRRPASSASAPTAC